MKILLTGFHFDTIGGLEIVSANIAHTLVDASHEVQWGCSPKIDSCDQRPSGFNGSIPGGNFVS